MSAHHTLPVRRELARRSSHGIDVSLLWCPTYDTLTVAVTDASAGSFELVVDPAEALEAFASPHSHAASRGLEHARPALGVAA